MSCLTVGINNTIHPTQRKPKRWAEHIAYNISNIHTTL